MIDTVFFDWDGTLNDSSKQSFEALRAALAAMNMPIEPETYDRVYSPNWYAMFEELRVPRDRWDEADRLWMMHYDYGASRLLPGAREGLAELARLGFSTGIVTSGSRVRILREIEAFGLSSAFLVVVCGEDVVNKKPHPEGLMLAMEQAQKGPDSCCYVGDCPDDIEMGRRAGVRTVGICSNYPSSRRLAESQPDLIFDSLHDFIEKLAAESDSKR